MNEKVSIIIPAYNVENYISDCLEGVVSQTYKNIEVLIINDGSTDNTLKICNKYKANDDRIKIINKKNEGVAEARNDGIKYSKGMYIAFIDSDDMISKKYIQTLMYTINKYDGDIVSCDFKKTRGKYNGIDKKKKVNIINFTTEGALTSLLYQKELDSSLWNKLIKKELFDGLNFNKLKKFEDLDIFYKLICNAKTITYIRSVLYYYRIRKESLMNNEFSGDNILVKDVVNRMKKYITSKYPQLENACNCRILSMYFYLYRNIDKYNPLYEECVTNILNLRSSVIKDKNISNKTRIGIYLSNINMQLIKLQNVLKV